MYRMYPIGHIGMKRKLWKKVLDIDDDFNFCHESLIESVKQVLDIDLIANQLNISKGNRYWSLDQRLISVKITEFIKAKHSSILLHRMNYTGLRLDRNHPIHKWKNINLNNLTDAHLFERDVIDKWFLVENLVIKLLNRDKEDYKFLKRYVDEYLMT